MTKEVAKKAGTEVSTAVNYGADEGAGVSDLTTKDIAIPFLVVLQKLSPQIDEDHKNHEQYEDLDAKVGQFFNTVTEEVYDSIRVINCGYSSCLVEWKPRESGGGFVAQHPDNSPLLAECHKNEKGQDVLPNGNLLVQTSYHYLLMLGDNNEVNQAVISLTSTQLKKSRLWNAKMLSLKIPVNGRMITPARFASIWELTTVPESNDKGSWRGIKLERVGLVEDADLYNHAREFHKLITSGRVQVTPPTGTDSVEAEVGASVPY